AANHIYEGRWLADQQYITDYVKFWMTGGGSPRVYSFWVADAVYNYYKINAYMYGDAIAISGMATILGHEETADRFAAKARSIKDKVQEVLWDASASFF